MPERTIDLHTHTTVSDGTDTPEELLAGARQAGLSVFSITDHDAVTTARTIPPLLREGDPAFVTGVEFSCGDGEGKYHILGYGYDPDAAPIRGLVDYTHDLRMKKLRARIESLRSDFGIVFPERDLEWLCSLENPGKPHFATLLIRNGYAATKEEAIGVIDRIRLNSLYIRPEEAVGGILDSGGIPVLAHPTFGSGEQMVRGEEMDRRVRKLMRFGLEGLEAYYSAFTEEIRAELLAFAKRYGLYVTAGSDYHGTNKNVRLGDTGLDAREQDYPEGLRRFLGDVRSERG